MQTQKGQETTQKGHERYEKGRKNPKKDRTGSSISLVLQTDMHVTSFIIVSVKAQVKLRLVGRFRRRFGVFDQATRHEKATT